jgi:hypothetical protein
MINRVAVYTLPTEMIGWYKPNIDYIAEHAVDPDKRRYATRHEAVRHYMDLDHWGKLPFDHVPRYWDQMLAYNLRLMQFDGEDTVFVLNNLPVEEWSESHPSYPLRLDIVRSIYQKRYYDDAPRIPGDSLMMLYPEIRCEGDYLAYLSDAASEHGILPYHLQAMQSRLTSAFRLGDVERVLRLSAEIGHYIGDACVPLHTTKNYNGQLTDQVGIHAFWESRIPELFAIDQFDMVVGGATYIDDPVTYYWELVLSSHENVHSVLSLEKELSKSFPADKQYCFEDRLNQNIRTQCADYALAYHQAMDKMVEERFRVAVKALGDAWYTAWIDAGQPAPPPARAMKKTLEDEELDKAVQSGKVLGRAHEN